MSKRLIAKWEYVPVLTLHEEDAGRLHKQQEFDEEDLEAMSWLDGEVRRQQEQMCERFGYQIGYKPFKLVYDKGHG